MLKSQASMESILTWGIAFFAVLISIYSLTYFGVLTPYFPNTCFFENPGIKCMDMSITSSGAQIVLKNFIGYQLTQVVLNLENCGYTTGPSIIEIGSAGTYSITCAIPGKRYEGEVNLSYTNSESLLVHNSIGLISSKVES